MWIAAAFASAFFAGVTSVLAKLGLSETDSDVATAVRTCVVLVMAWGIVLGKGKLALVRRISRRDLVFLVLSGVATGASWLCYFYAVQTGVVSVVVPIDKLSLVVTVAFSALVLRERLSHRALGGLALVVLGTLLMLFAR